MNKGFFLMLAVVLFLAVGACKKSKVDPTTPTDTSADEAPPATTNRTELSLDSIFLYAKQIYYWNDKLPTYKAFNPRQYTGTTDLDRYEAELFGIAEYSTSKYDIYKSNGVYQNYPKFSYISDKTNKNPTAYINPTASVDLEGNGNDVGIRFAIFTYSNDPGYLFFVGGVYPGSSAETEGVTRGDLIKKINGVSFGANYNSEYDALDKALESSSMSIEVIKANGSTATYNLTKTVFKSSPIYKSRVITADSKKIGYLAYARFSNAENSEVALTNVINGFASSGVTDLIIDLRYNGGGYVSTAEHLINLLAPSSTSGVMFTEYFNATMQTGNAKILANQPLLDAAGKIRYSTNGKMLTYADVNYATSANVTNFAKKGNLTNIGKIVFLVTRNTASASELVINSLKPFVNVSLVGATTYGKPIGFFPITIENKYDVYFSLFETKNSLGEGGYYEGMTPTVSASEIITGSSNYIMYDFGDIRDGLTKQALEIIAPNAVTVSSNAAVKSSLSKSVQTTNANNGGLELVDKEFKGMVETRFKLKN